MEDGWEEDARRGRRGKRERRARKKVDKRRERDRRRKVVEGEKRWDAEMGVRDKFREGWKEERTGRE